MSRQKLNSWGRVVKQKYELLQVSSRFDPIPDLPRGIDHFLPYGNGRSYGDSCLNPGGALLLTRGLDRFIQFDPATGVLAAEAGVLLSDILRLIVPQGWFVAVTPGTRLITLGGAIANDVHGKNHHTAGTFGCHVRKLELLTSDGQRRVCSPLEHPDWFAATIGGLGLTGVITWAEIQLRRIANPWIDAETLRFGGLDEFFALSKESDQDYEYTVSWIDCAGQGQRLGRGLFMRGNHAPAWVESGAYRLKTKTFPFVPPLSLVNPLSLSAFNALYYRKQWADRVRAVQHYEPFFYPLDGILEWNRIYGPSGFYQYQCVLPDAECMTSVKELLRAIAESGMGSFLAVLKVFGSRESPGLLSFPQAGATLALDFPNRGSELQVLFERLDMVVSSAGGRLYPAKDGRMSPAMFKSGFPRWEMFSNYIDPRCSSRFWRRVTENP